ncbi:MAG: hypothetical protein Q9157_006104 [Trypethelium eluteriae]
MSVRLRMEPASSRFFSRLALASAVAALLAVLLTWLGLPISFPFLHQQQNLSTILIIDPQTEVSYRGTINNDVEHFQNIFYAEDTGGKNRFTPPVPRQPLPGTVIDATAAGAWCPQFVGPAPLPFTSPITNVSEDCLSLRIARPRGTNSSSKLPVLVWLHGDSTGGNALGSGYDQLYEPDGLVRQANKNGQPVIWVAINYRLGRVRDNIAAFGGEPRNIVAIGQSVGAMSIGLHMTSFSGNRGVPFQKAM